LFEFGRYVTFDLEKFIYGKVLGYSGSLFADDLERFHDELQDGIDGRAVLVIGSVWTIGSSIKVTLNDIGGVKTR
jgi:hypothetical protein